MISDLLTCSDAVAEARARNAPIVALESTIITHGLPYPKNLETARQVEDEVRAAGAVPATIAITDGKIRIGLSDAELCAIAESKGALKVSRADFASALTTGQVGSTTVAATAIAAHMAGISVFATGGIGGVHRGAETSFDVSADLEELARTPIVVVSAGAKAILDLPKTLEVLETKGVPVVGYQTSDFPAFWSRRSGLTVPIKAETCEDVAALFHMQQRLNFPAGILVANPVPLTSEISLEEMAGYIEAAQAEADRQGVSGKAVTPFLLARIAELTDGRSIETNIALIRNNAQVASKIAAKIVNGVEAGITTHNPVA